MYISQDLLRKAAAPGGGHGEPGLGYEILHTNIGGALDNVGFVHEEFDYAKLPTHLQESYIEWLKLHLAQGHSVVWFILCGMMDHNAYQNPKSSL